MPWNASARWYEARRAQNRKPATYTCPLCGRQLPSLIEHTLIFPEGDHAARRHAHTACVLKARANGKLPTKHEWERAQREVRKGGAKAAAANARADGDPENTNSGGVLAALKRVLRGPRGDSRPT